MKEEVQYTKATATYMSKGSILFRVMNADGNKRKTKIADEFSHILW